MMPASAAELVVKKGAGCNNDEAKRGACTSGSKEGREGEIPIGLPCTKPTGLYPFSETGLFSANGSESAVAQCTIELLKTPTPSPNVETDDRAEEDDGGNRFSSRCDPDATPTLGAADSFSAVTCLTLGSGD